MTRGPSAPRRSLSATRQRVSRILLPLVAVILLSLLPAGCAGGEQGGSATKASGSPPTANQVRLIVSRDFGATVLVDATVAAGDDMSVMRLLAKEVKVETAYGGGFVKSIDGLTSTYGTVGDAEAQDWFYWVDGVMADIGAADFKLSGGETVWWDYHVWANAMFLPAAVVALPAPWNDGSPHLVMNGDDTLVRSWASDNGIDLGTTQKLGDRQASGVVVATAAEARSLPWLKKRLAGDDGGVELVAATAQGLELRSLDGKKGPSATAACLALPNPDNADQPLLVLLVNGTSDLEPLLESVSPATIRARLGVALVDGSLTALPWQHK